jgi:hypothetical protein
LSLLLVVVYELVTVGLGARFIAALCFIKSNSPPDAGKAREILPDEPGFYMANK